MEIDFGKFCEKMRSHSIFFFPSSFFPSSNVVVLDPVDGIKYFSSMGWTAELLKDFVASTIILPVALIDKLLKLKGGAKVLKVEEKEGHPFKVSIGGLSVTVDTPTLDYAFPSFSEFELVPVPDDFLPSLLEVSLYASGDSRKQNLNGVWWDKSGQLFAYDNYRVIKCKRTFQNILTQSLLFPLDFLVRIGKVPSHLNMIAITERLIVFCFEEAFLVFSPVPAVGLLPISEAFDAESSKGGDCEWIELDTETSGVVLSDASLFLYEEDGQSFVVDISIERGASCMSVSGRSRFGTKEVSFLVPLHSVALGEVKFRVDSKFLVDACSKFSKFRKNSEKYLLFEDDKYALLVGRVS